MVSNLTRQLDLDETERRLFLQWEQRLQLQILDLTNQVCFLMREVSELRGNRLLDEPMDDDRVSSSEGSAAAIISRHLVTFRDVHELQQKNQLLLTTLREVVEKCESMRPGASETILERGGKEAAQMEVQLTETPGCMAAAESSRTSPLSPALKSQLARLQSTTTEAAPSQPVGDLQAPLTDARADNCKKVGLSQKKKSKIFEVFSKGTVAKETAHQFEEFSHKITRLEADLASVTEQLKLAQESEAKARQESLEQVKNAKEAQEKYERELMQHAADVEQLNAVREQLELNRSQFAVVQQTLARTETELESGRTSWESQKEMLEKDASEKSRRCSELDKQIDLMEQQIVTLSARMAAATRVQEIAVRFVLILDSKFWRQI